MKNISLLLYARRESGTKGFPILNFFDMRAFAFVHFNKVMYYNSKLFTPLGGQYYAGFRFSQ